MEWATIGEVSHRPDVNLYVNKTCILNDGHPTSFQDYVNIFTLKEIDRNIFEWSKDDDRIGLSIDLMDQEMIKNEDGHWTVPLNKKNRNIRRLLQPEQ